MAKLNNILSIALPLMLLASPALSACVNPTVFPAGAFCDAGITCLFSTMANEFTSMVGGMVGKLYCGVQSTAETTVKAAIVLFIAIYGFQVTMGLAQINGKDAVTRLIKLSVVYLVVSSNSAWSAGMGIVYDFYMGFIAESTKWVMDIFGSLPGGVGVNIPSGGPAAAFALMDQLIITNFDINETGAQSLLTELKADAALKIFMFFLAMLAAMPSIFWLAVYWALSVFMVCMRTTIVFLVATVAIGLLLSLSPIFVSFMLFQTTYRFFETWLKFMTSFALQVAFSFAVLAMYLYTLTLFKPFFIELSAMIFPIKETVQFAGPGIKPTDSYGVCRMEVKIGDILDKLGNPTGGKRPEAKCFPVVPVGTEFLPRDIVVTPAGVTQQHDFIMYLFYNMISLVIVSYGFASMQKNLQSIATSIAGPQSVPSLAGGGSTMKDKFDAARGGASKAASESGASGGFMSQFNNSISKR